MKIAPQMLPSRENRPVTLQQDREFYLHLSRSVLACLELRGIVTAAEYMDLQKRLESCR